MACVDCGEDCIEEGIEDHNAFKNRKEGMGDCCKQKWFARVVVDGRLLCIFIELESDGSTPGQRFLQSTRTHRNPQLGHEVFQAAVALLPSALAVESSSVSCLWEEEPVIWAEEGVLRR